MNIKSMLFVFSSVLLILGCSVDEKLQLPEISTQEISLITDSSAVSGGIITSIDETIVLTRGICWSLDTIPTIADFRTIDGSGIGSFVSTMSGLYPNMDYYVRAYYTTNDDTVYGNEFTFKSLRRAFSIPGPDIEYTFSYSGNGIVSAGNWQLIDSETIMGEHLQDLITDNETSILGAIVKNGKLILSGSQYNFNGVDSVKICYKLINSNDLVDFVSGSPSGSNQDTIVFGEFKLSIDKTLEMIDNDKVVSVYALFNHNTVNFLTTDAILTFNAQSSLKILWK